MVIKVLRSNLYNFLSTDTRIQISPYPRKELPHGKVTLSLKLGKKRKLVTGRIDSAPASSQFSCLQYDFFFMPNNPKKLRELLSKIDGWEWERTKEKVKASAYE